MGNRTRVAEIHRQLAELHRELAEQLDRIEAGEDWVDQHHSPLGKRRHLDAVRDGKLDGYKPDRNHVFVRRADLDAFIRRSKLKKAKLAPEPKPIVETERDPVRAAAKMGARLGLVRVR